MSLQSDLEQLGHPIVDGNSRILTIDIERHPGEAYWYDAKTDYIPARNVKEYPRTVCYAARWYGHDNIIFAAEWHKGGHQTMLEKAWKLYQRGAEYGGRGAVRQSTKRPGIGLGKMQRPA